VTDLLGTCRRKGCAGRMDKIVRDLLDRALPPDAPQKCAGRFYAGVTVMDAALARPRSVLASVIDGINTRADMIATLVRSGGGG
jgi:hypothetical protein